MSNAKTAKLSD